MAILAALMLLAAVVAYACARAGADADDYAERLYDAATRTINYDAEADMLREAMEEEHW